MKKEPNINIDKLRQSQLVKDEYYNNSEKIKADIEEKRQKREEAKQAIIKKINEGANQTTKQPETRIKKDETPQNFFKRTEVKKETLQQTAELPINIRVIKNDNPLATQEQVKQASEKLSYTLQMDVVSKDQVSMYKKRKERMQSIKINDKFAKFTPKITKIYLIITLILLVLIALALFFIQ